MRVKFFIIFYYCYGRIDQTIYCLLYSFLAAVKSLNLNLKKKNEKHDILNSETIMTHFEYIFGTYKKD